MVLKRVSVKRNPPDSVERALETLWKYLSPRQRHQLELWVLRHFALIFLLLLAVPRARAQFLGFVSPQTDQETVFTAVNSAQTFKIHNIGQNLHLLTYTTVGTITSMDLRIEGSNDGVAWFAISEDATTATATGGPGSGAIYAAGYYPAVRINLVEFVGAGGASLSASYAGTSASAVPPLGSYNGSQSLMKVALTNASAGSTGSSMINAPFGSTLGYAIVHLVSGSFPVGSSLTVEGVLSQAVTALPNFSLNTTASFQFFAISAIPGTSVEIVYNSGGASAATYDAYYLFVQPGAISGLTGPGIQAPVTFNSELTSAANAAVTNSIAAIVGQRVNLFSVSARCSAGSASLTVKDGVGGTVIWTTGATEVGTTTFRFQWNPGLASTISKGMDLVVSACGLGNTGTLDVQASQQ